MLSVANKPFVLSVVMPSVVMLNVVLLSVLAPFESVNRNGKSVRALAKVVLSLRKYCSECLLQILQLNDTNCEFIIYILAHSNSNRNYYSMLSILCTL